MLNYETSEQVEFGGANWLQGNEREQTTLLQTWMGSDKSSQ